MGWLGGGYAGDHGFPVTVFIKRGTDVLPVQTVAEHEFALDSLAGRLRLDVEPRYHFAADTLLQFVRWHGSIRAGKEVADVHAFEPMGGKTGWGILYRAEDATRPFVRRIFDKEHQAENGPAAQIAAASIALWEAPGVESVFPALRVYRGDSLIASSPNVDTTRIAFDDTFDGLRFVYYASAMDQKRLEQVGVGHFPWLLLILEVALMVIVFTFHRWMKRLTA